MLATHESNISACDVLDNIAGMLQSETEEKQSFLSLKAFQEHSDLLHREFL